MMLVKNMLLKWLDDQAEGERVERILWIEPSRAYVYTFDIEDKSALPVWSSYAKITEALNQAQAIVVTQTDRYLLQPEEQFTEKQRQRRDENWALIEPIVNAGESACLAMALNRRCRLVTDDRDAREYARRLQIPLSGTLGILIRLVEIEHLTIEQADGLLSRMLEAGYRSPVLSLRELF